MADNPTSSTASSSQLSRAESLENIRCGYLAAAQLTAYEGQLAWLGFAAYAPIAALLLIGSLAAAFPLADQPFQIAFLRTVSAGLGLVATLAWWAMVSRSRTMQTFWINSGRILEEQLIGVKTMQHGKHLTERGYVEIAGLNKPVRFSPIGSFSHRVSFNIIFTICTGIFSALSFWNVIRLTQTV